MAKKTDKASVQKAAAKKKRADKVKQTQTNGTAAPAEAGPGHNLTDEQNQALFLYHLADPKNTSNITALKKALESANSALRLAYKKAKADGFTKKDFETAFEIQKANGEKERIAAIKRDIQIAKWLGCDLGAQMDLFERMIETGVPAEDRAYEEGKVASYEGKSAKPPYDPSLVQHRRWLEGWHFATELRIKDGITKLHPEVAKDEADKAAKKAERKAQQDKDAAAFEPPASGVAMTREEYKKKQAEQDGKGDLTVN